MLLKNLILPILPILKKQKKYKELDKKIEREPNNYKYYAQRADISYEPLTDCSPRMFYQNDLIDYEKALSLNPNATVKN